MTYAQSIAVNLALAMVAALIVAAFIVGPLAAPFEILSRELSCGILTLAQECGR